MPYKSKRPCKYSGCPLLTDKSYCDEHKKLTDTQYNKYHRDPESNKRYDWKWKIIRNRYITAHPLCEQCEKENRLVPATEVHHIIALSAGGTHGQENLMSLCHSCHSKITARNP